MSGKSKNCVPTFKVVRLGKNPVTARCYTPEEAVEQTGGMPEGHEMHVTGFTVTIVPRNIKGAQ